MIPQELHKVLADHPGRSKNTNFNLRLLHKCLRGEKAPHRPWEGADSLEWTHLPTPAPYHSFEKQPVIR